MKAAAPWVVFTSLQSRFFCEPQAGERAGHWVHAPALATAYPTKADAEAAMRRITSVLTRHHTRVITQQRAYAIAGSARTPAPQTEQEPAE